MRGYTLMNVLDPADAQDVATKNMLIQLIELSFLTIINI